MPVRPEIGEWSSEADSSVRVGRRRSRALRRCVVGLVLIAAGLGGLFALDGSVAHLRATGVHAEAQVLGFVPSTLLGQTRLQITYPDPSDTYSADLQVDAPASHEGQIAVVYAKGDPGRVVVARGPTLSSTGVLGAACMFGMGIGAVVILFAIADWRRAPEDEAVGN